MSKPTQYELDTTRETLEYLIANMNEHEPYAVSTIADFESCLGNIPEEDEITEHAE